MRAPAKCRIYILSHHRLFAEGIGSLLRGKRAIEILGIEGDLATALAAIESLRPDVVVFEQSKEGIDPVTLWTILLGKTPSRVVCLNLEHNFAAVYESHRVAISRPEELVGAIRGGLHGRRKPFTHGTTLRVTFAGPVSRP